jgi:hypothetical protein
MTRNAEGMSPLENHPAHTQALGMMSVEIGVLETNLGELLGALLGIEPHVGQIVYMTPQSYIGRLSILENVANNILISESDALKRIRAYLKRAKARIQYRNDCTHGIWGVKKADRTIVTRRSAPYMEGTKAIAVPIIDLQTEIAKIRELTDDIIKETAYVVLERQRFQASQQKLKKLNRGVHNVG